MILTTRSKRLRLRDEIVVSMCLDCLAGSASRFAFDILAYCFMPDHLHLLAVGDEDSSLVRFVQHFKQATGHRFPGLWQRSFYDHIVRSEEALKDVADHIWANPVRAGLVEDPVDYRFSGPRESMTAVAERAKHL